MVDRRYVVMVNLTFLSLFSLLYIYKTNRKKVHKDFRYQKSHTNYSTQIMDSTITSIPNHSSSVLFSEVLFWFHTCTIVIKIFNTNLYLYILVINLSPWQMKCTKHIFPEFTVLLICLLSKYKLFWSNF